MINQNSLKLLILFFALSGGHVFAQETTAKTPRERVVTAAPQTSPTPTVADLQNNIRRVLQNPALQRGQIGVKIVALASGKTIFEENADKYFVPASNMKAFTVAAALDRLTPDFRFVTSVYAAAKPDANGEIKGDLIVYGRGDPTFAASLNNGDYALAVNNLADKIAASGVTKISGNLIGDDSYFSGDKIGANWEWNDLQWYYGAQISALSVNDNAVDLRITANGATPTVQILPINPFFTVTNQLTAGTKRELQVTKKLGANALEIRGTMPAGDEYKGSVAVENPAQMFVYLLKNALQQKGVGVTGQAVENRQTFNPNSVIEIARLESPPLSYIAAKTLKPSQNLYTELILRALGEAVGDKSNLKKTSAERGLEVVQKFLQTAGIQPDAVIQFDASGLSRHDLITPSATAQLYQFMSKHRYAQTFEAALPIGGVDGTLKNRFRNSPAANNVHAKTGTLDQVGSISGYITAATGERFAFSILTNNLPDAESRRRVMDDITLLIANFNGKVE